MDMLWQELHHVVHDNNIITEVFYTWDMSMHCFPVPIASDVDNRTLIAQDEQGICQ